MKITNIAVAGFKGGTGEYPLSGLDVFTGPNGSGKTRILQAVQLAISGAVPKLNDDTNVEIITMFPTDGNDRMSVDVKFDNDSTINREFVIGRTGGKDSVKQVIAIDNLIIGTDEAKPIILERVGDFPVMLDVHDFIRMSDAKRAALIFQFAPVDVERWNATTVTAALMAAIMKFPKPEAQVQAIIDLLATGSINVAIVNCLAKMKENESFWKKALKESQAASTGAVKSTTTDGKSSLRHVEDIEGEIKLTRINKEALITSIEQTKATRQAWARLNQEKSELVNKIEAKRKEVNPDAIAEMKANITRLEHEIILIPLGRGAIEARESAVAHLKVASEEARRMVSDYNTRLRIAEEKHNALKDGKCPVCGQKTHDVAQETGKLLEVYKMDFTTASSSLVSLTEEIGVEEQARIQAQQSYEINRNLVESKKNELAGIVNRVASSEGGMQYLLDMQKKLEELNHTAIDGEMINLDEAELQKQGLDESLRNLSAELERKRDYDTKISLAKETHLKAKRAEETLELVKALIEKLTEIRWQIVREALEPIKQEAAELFAVAGQKAEFDFQFKDRRGNEVFRFGWQFKGLVYDSFVDFDSLSTAQQLFTLVSLLGPLIHRGNPKLRLLLLDNTEIVDSMNQDRFMNLLIAAKEKYLDNILVASSRDIPYVKSDTIEVHQL